MGALAQRIQDAIFELPLQQRRAAVARYVDGLAPDEIDACFGWKRNTAHVYLSHARKAIRRRLLTDGSVSGRLRLPPGDGDVQDDGARDDEGGQR